MLMDTQVGEVEGWQHGHSINSLQTLCTSVGKILLLLQ